MTTDLGELFSSLALFFIWTAMLSMICSWGYGGEHWAKIIVIMGGR
jgi:hypothetical protein